MISASAVESPQFSTLSREALGIAEPAQDIPLCHPQIPGPQGCEHNEMVGLGTRLEVVCYATIVTQH